MNTSLSRQGGRRYGQFRSSFPIAMTGFLSGFGTSATIVPVVTAQPGAAGRRRRRQKIVLRLNGGEYEVSNLAEVLELVRAAKKDVPDLAKAKAAEIIVSGKRIGDARRDEASSIEVVSAPEAVREVIEDRVAEMERFYWDRIQTHLRALEDDEEDVWLLN